MKNLFSILAVFVCLSTASAQSENASSKGKPITEKLSGSASVTLNIKLHHVMGIEVNGKDVNFKYETIGAYKSDQEVKKEDHLNVYSTTPFDLLVKAVGPNFESDIKDKFSVGVVDIAVNNIGEFGGKTGKVNLKKSNITLVDKAPAGISKNLDVTYSISGDNASKVLFGKGATTYTQTVMYTVIPG